MCGLNFTYDNESTVIEMCQAMSYRGTRSSSYSYKGHSFGHVRLPILGLGYEFDQPFFFKNWIFLFTGEIFNYKQLLPWAESDIEVLSYFWDKEGIDCFKRFDGFWSMIAFDRITENLHVVVDYLAKKPLYIHLPSLSISSEIKPFFKRPYEFTIDKKYISSVCKWGYRPDESTPFNEIKKIKAGSYTILSSSKKIINETIYDPLKMDKSIYLKTAIKDAIKNRIISDVPISLLLSGGLDSSIVYYYLEKETHDFTIFHIDNEEAEFLNYLNIPDSIKVIKLDLKNPKIKEVLYYNECPVDLGSMLSQYAIAEAISETGIQVALSGDGADELFGGYTRISDYDSQYSDVFDELVFYHIPRLDKLMMSKTIELRCPFLARPVIESALSLPYKDRMHKAILKKIFEKELPDEILERKKIPLKSPIFKQGGLEYRYKLVDLFLKEIVNEYK